MSLSHHTTRLPNGLEIIGEAHPDSHSFAAGLFVRAGSRDETAPINGVSHFLEHMMFKGSGEYSWQDVNRIFDELGARYNAFTTQEMTAYYANVLPEFSRRTIDHLAHLLRPAIRQGDFDTEKKVILEEIAMYQDDPGHRIYEKLMELHFADHPLGMSVLGAAEVIERLPRDRMADYFARNYGPGNMVLVVTGRFDFQQVVEWADERMGQWNGVRRVRRADRPRPQKRRERLVDPKLNRHYLMAMMPAPPVQDERRYAAKALSDVIGDAEGSRLYWALVDNAIAEEADFGYSPHDGCGAYYLELISDPDRAARAYDIALGELGKVAEDLGDDEVDRAKNKIASQIVLEGESPLGRLRSIGAMWVYDQPYHSLEQDMRILESLTAESLRSLVADFPLEPTTVVELTGTGGAD